MKLFGKNIGKNTVDTSSVPPELQQYYQPQPQVIVNKREPLIAMLITFVISALIFGLVVWIILSHTSKSDTSTTKPKTTQTQSSPSTGTKTPSTGKTNTKPVAQPGT